MNNLELLTKIDNLLARIDVEKIGCDDCEHGGDPTDCWSCAEGCDCFYFNGECVCRNANSSKWKRIELLEPVYSGTNDEIKSIGIMGWECDKPHTRENGTIIAAVWQDLGSRGWWGVKYNDEEVQNDTFVLSYIIEILRKKLDI